MRTRVKFCGVTQLDDALAAVECGVDALGFVFVASSPRAIAPEAAAALIASLPPLVAKIGLFVNANLAIVARIAEITGIDTLQLHGNETPAYCSQAKAQTGLPYVKAFAVASGFDSRTASAAYPDAAAILLDTYDPARAGGTGTSFDWQLAPKDFHRPVILAGGLNPGNVATAIRTVRPFAVDVSSGIEARPGVKDRDKMRRFMVEVLSVA